jgi:hypothetical protein
MTYKQIADALGLRSASAALTLIKGFHPSLVQMRASRNGGVRVSAADGTTTQI